MVAPVGSGFGLLDFNPIIKKIGGKLFPFGWFHLLMGKKNLECVRIISTNVLLRVPEVGLGAGHAFSPNSISA